MDALILAVVLLFVYIGLGAARFGQVRKSARAIYRSLE
jgi:hypothetical protein